MKQRWLWTISCQLQPLPYLGRWKFLTQGACIPKTTSWETKESVVDCQVYCRQKNHGKLTFNRLFKNCACCDIAATVEPGIGSADVYIQEGNIQVTRKKFGTLLNIFSCIRI